MYLKMGEVYESYNSNSQSDKLKYCSSLSKTSIKKPCYTNNKMDQ